MVEDEFIVREGIARLLSAERSLRVLPPCSSVAAAEQVLLKDAVDVVLLDFNLGGGTSTPLVRKAREFGFKGKILLLTAGLTDDHAIELLRLGISGIVLKKETPEILVNAILRVAHGELWLDQKYLRLLVGQLAHRDTPAPKDVLTPREFEILRAILEGLTNKEIAVRLRVSEGTVKAALQQLFFKSGVNSRSQLVRVGMEKYSHLL